MKITHFWNRYRLFWRKFRFSLMDDGYARADFLRKKKILKGIGEHVYFYSRILPADPQLVLLHDNISIATNVRFITHDRIDVVLNGLEDSEVHVNKKYGCIEVMDDVFIGADVTILPGVRIGPRAIIGAGSVVTKDVLPGTIAGGNPAREIGSFDNLAGKRMRHPDYSAKPEKLWRSFEKKHRSVKKTVSKKPKLQPAAKETTDGLQ